MVYFDRKKCQSQAKNLGYNAEFCANCTLGRLNFARKSFALSGCLFALSGFALRGGPQKRADSYFPPEDGVRLVRLVSHGELPGERLVQ